MLWKQLNPRYRKLLRDGQQGQAVVVEAEADGARDDMRTDSTGLFGWNATIRVKYDDGTTADFRRYIEAKSADGIAPGVVVPIRFDPRKRSRLEIDVEALNVARAAQSAQAEAAEEAAVQQAEHQLQPLDTDPPAYPGT